MPGLRKINSLTISQLNKVLHDNNITMTGNKAAKVAKLVEFLGNDEIEAEEIETGQEHEIQRLNAIVSQLTSAVQTLTVAMQQQPAGSGATPMEQPAVPSQTSPSEEITALEGSHRLPWAVREAIGLLPEFDPIKKDVTSQQFISKAEQLQVAYNWSSAVLLFAAQHQLRGAAKVWLDAANVFTSWERFVEEFKRDFPTHVSSADCHRELMKGKRKPTQTLLEFYYAMLAVGRRGNVDDASIVSYIIEGLNDAGLTRTLQALNVSSSSVLMTALENVSDNTGVGRHDSTSTRHLEKQKSETTFRAKTGIKCYNCNEVGHIAVNCSKPQKKQRCEKCLKTGHDEKQCRMGKRGDVSTVQQEKFLDGHVPPLFKSFQIGTETFQGFVDTGSACSLIDQSMVPKGIECTTQNMKLRGFGGATVESVRVFETDIILDGNTIHARFHVVPDKMSSHPVLLGRDVLCYDLQTLQLGDGELKLLVRDSEASKEVLNIQHDILSTIRFNPQLNEQQRQDMSSVIVEFEDVFAEDLSRLGRSKSTLMEIEVTTNEPIVGKRYQIPFAQRETLSVMLKNLRDHGIIRPSASPHAASVVMVKKSNGEYRMCVDYRALNAVTVKRHFPMPLVEEQLSKLSEGRHFTILDMTAGYYQIPLEEKSKAYTAFATHEGLYEHEVMPFGLVNAPMRFQEMIMRVIATIPSRHQIVSYVDEVIIASSTVEDGIRILKEFLQAVRKEGLTLRPSKCVFLESTVKFLGHIVSRDGIKPSAEKTSCIRDFPTPKSATEVRRFLGVTGFFRRFVYRYGHIAEPLTKLLRKNIPFSWGLSQQTAFNQLKTTLMNEPTLALYNQKKSHEVHTDACIVGLSGILLQEEHDGLKPVFFFSRQCSEPETKYSSHELEVLAIVEALERFRLYLMGSEFRVVTDCNAVVTTKAITPLPSRIARWWLKLQEFNFTCVHRAGAKMGHVDGMSRSPTLGSSVATTVADAVFTITADSSEDWIAAMQRQDDDIKTIFGVLQGNTSSGQTQIRSDYELHKFRLYRKVNGERRLVVPRAIRWRITRASHDEAGHFGVDKTVERIAKDFWFPRIRRYVKTYIAACPECCFNKAQGGKPEGQLHISAIVPVPFRRLHLDHLGPFPKSKGGAQYVIVLVCAFTKYSIIKAVRNTKTTPVLNLLRDTMAIFGQPMMIVTDRGTAYTSKEFATYMHKWGIEHIKVAVRTPRANGQAERINKTLLTSLKCATTNKREWDALLPSIQWAINSQSNATTRFAPNDLIFNFNLRNVSENRIVQALHDEQPESPENPEDLKLSAAENIAESQVRWKRRFDEKHREPRKYGVGDLVVIDFIPGATGESHKLDPKYKGPYIVSKVLDADRYIVEDLPDAPRNQRRYNSVVSSDHMKPWCSLGQGLDFADDDATDSSGEDERAGKAELSTEVE